MKRIFRPVIAGLSFVGVAALSLVAPSPPADAGFLPDFIHFSFYNGTWSRWVTFSEFSEVDLENASAAIVALSISVGSTSGCIEFGQPIGTRQQFTYSVDANQCVGIEGVGTTVTLPLALFVWFPISDGALSANNPCWDVRGTTSTEGDFGTRIRFSETLFAGSLATESVSGFIDSIVAEVNAIRANSASLVARDRLYGTPYVPFVFEIDTDEPPAGGITGPEDSIWTIGVSISSCREEVDDDLLEHYRRQAELVTALPDTQ